jgi:hypothetical protein
MYPPMATDIYRLKRIAQGYFALASLAYAVGARKLAEEYVQNGAWLVEKTVRLSQYDTATAVA